MLFGRDAERSTVARLVREAAAACGGSLVVVGEPGVGKTALLNDAVSGLGGFRVLRTQGVESESPLAFAALYRLLRPVLDRVGRLPAPQARALRVAFGQEEGPAGDRFLVFMAGLDRSAALLLISERAGVHVSDEVCDRLMAQTGGNPLALEELPATLSPGQLTGRARSRGPNVPARSCGPRGRPPGAGMTRRPPRA